jgi:hypothetical protein
MSILGATTAASTVMLTAAMTLAAPASASPDNLCGATLIPICAFAPVLPGLDHDVDLTTGPQGPEPDALTPDVAQFRTPPTDGR